MTTSVNPETLGANTNAVAFADESMNDFSNMILYLSQVFGQGLTDLTNVANQSMEYFEDKEDEIVKKEQHAAKNNDSNDVNAYNAKEGEVNSVANSVGGVYSSMQNAASQLLQQNSQEQATIITQEGYTNQISSNTTTLLQTRAS